MRRESLCVNVYQVIRVISVTLAPQDTLACPHCTHVPLVSVQATSMFLIPRPVTEPLENVSSVYTILKDRSVQLVLTSSLAMPLFPIIVNVSWPCSFVCYERVQYDTSLHLHSLWL